MYAHPATWSPTLRVVVEPHLAVPELVGVVPSIHGPHACSRSVWRPSKVHHPGAHPGEPTLGFATLSDSKLKSAPQSPATTQFFLAIGASLAALRCARLVVGAQSGAQRWSAVRGGRAATGLKVLL